MDDQNRISDEAVHNAASIALAGLENAVRNGRAMFVARLAREHETLENAAKAAMDGGEPASSLAEAMFIAHRIAGIGKTLGFPDLGDAARQTETAIDAYRRAHDSTDLRDAAVSQIRHLAGLMDAICAAQPTAPTADHPAFASGQAG